MEPASAFDQHSVYEYDAGGELSRPGVRLYRLFFESAESVQAVFFASWSLTSQQGRTVAGESLGRFRSQLKVCGYCHIKRNPACEGGARGSNPGNDHNILSMPLCNIAKAQDWY